jgi:phosphatidylcholine synthase
MRERSAAPADQGTPARKVRAYLVHVYTASGIAFAFLAATEIASAGPDARLVFVLLVIAVLIDATDGPLARRWEVKRWAAAIDGRTIDDIIDYLTYTFLPLLLVWRMGWLPDPAALWIVPALVASLFGFANVVAKDEAAGYFLGFPSYWNVIAFYLGIWYHQISPWWNAAIVVLFTALTVLPVRFVYPNLAPRPWRMPLIVGGAVWLGVLLYMLIDYPDVPAWLVWLTVAYPGFHMVLSGYLWHWRGRRIPTPGMSAGTK